jgi:hypothetical protein
MSAVLKCRRSIIAIIAIACLTALGILKNFDVSSAIAMVAMGVAGANSAEHVFIKKPSKPKTTKK